MRPCPALLGLLRRHGAVLLLTLVGLGLPATLKAAPIYVFGDSLSDTGNVFLATGEEIPPSPPYYQGRFSNGPLYVDRIAAALGTEVAPVLGGGTNYAFGGAEVLGGALIPSLRNQADLFLTGLPAGGADPDGLYIVFGGGNDVRAVLQGGAAPESVPAAAQELANIVGDLAEAGAREFLVPNLPNVGRTPEAIAAGPAAVAAAQSLSLAFNQTLAGALPPLGVAYPIDLVTLDTFALLEQLVAMPGAFGFTNVTDPCLVGGTVCADPDSYLFWDDVHPTSANGAVLARAALAALGEETAVPEPQILTLVAAGLAGMMALRRRLLSGRLARSA